MRGGGCLHTFFSPSSVRRRSDCIKQGLSKYLLRTANLQSISGYHALKNQLLIVRILPTSGLPRPKSMAKCKQGSRGYLKQTEVGGGPSRRHGLHLSTFDFIHGAHLIPPSSRSGSWEGAFDSCQHLHWKVYTESGSREDEGRKIVRERARGGKE